MEFIKTERRYTIGKFSTFNKKYARRIDNLLQDFRDYYGAFHGAEYVVADIHSWRTHVSLGGRCLYNAEPDNGFLQTTKAVVFIRGRWVELNIAGYEVRKDGVGYTTVDFVASTATFKGNRNPMVLIELMRTPWSSNPKDNYHRVTLYPHGIIHLTGKPEDGQERDIHWKVNMGTTAMRLQKKRYELAALAWKNRHKPDASGQKPVQLVETADPDGD